MGAGASAVSAELLTAKQRTDIKYRLDVDAKADDASDIEDLNTARAEVARLRKVVKEATRFCDDAEQVPGWWPKKEATNASMSAHTLQVEEKPALERRASAHSKFGAGTARLVKADCSTPPVMEFPMHVIKLRDLITLTEMEPMQSLKKKGKVVEYKDGMSKVAFFSHQWLAFDHPDPDMKQMGVIKEFFSTLPQRKHDLHVEWTGQIFAGESTTIPVKQLVDELDEMWIWYDFFSIPQIGADDLGTEEQVTNLMAAVRSIPAYIETASYFFVVAPLAKHKNSGTMNVRKSARA